MRDPWGLLRQPRIDPNEDPLDRLLRKKRELLRGLDDPCPPWWFPFHSGESREMMIKARRQRIKEEIREIDQKIKKELAYKRKAESVLNSHERRARTARGGHKARLELVEARRQLRIDGKWYDYAGEQTGFFLRALLDAAGSWKPAKQLLPPTRSCDESPRADRIYKSLPEAIRKIIEVRRGGGGGYRIKPEYFAPWNNSAV